MSFTISRDINNEIIKKSVTISTVPTINNTKSIGTTGIIDIATVTTLNFNGTNVTASSTQLNYSNVTPGVATANKLAVLDSNRSIAGITAVSSTNLVVNGTNITASLYENTTSDDLNSPYLTGITTGTALASKTLIPNSSRNISGINNISSKTITLNNSLVSNTVLLKNLNLDSFNNKRLTTTASIASLVSDSPTSWTQLFTQTTAINSIYWKSICWSPELGLFVAVGSGTSSGYTTVNNRVMSSPDGLTWTIGSSAADNIWNSVCWSSELSLFVAVSSNGTTSNNIMSSSNGITWTSRVSPIANSWYSICWSPELNLFVAVAQSGAGNRIMKSSDGINWYLSNSVPDNNWTSICWSSELNLFVVVATTGTNRILISSNGINWTSIPEPSGTSSTWNSVCWSTELGLFVAVASSGTNNKNFMRSSDGLNWIPSFEVNGSAGSVVTWSKDLEIFMAIDGTGNYCSYSYDGILWTRFLITSSSNVPQPGAIIWSSEYKMFIVVSNYGGSSAAVGSRIWYTYPCSTGSKGGSVVCSPSTIYADQSNNYVGINTTNPGRPLEINSVGGNCLKQISANDSTKYYSFDVLNTGQCNINTVKYFNIPSDHLTYGLLLNNILLKSTATELNNYLMNITPGVAQASKPVILDSSSNISGINFINCNTLTVDGSNIDYANNNQYFQNVSNGISSASKALITDSSNNITGINNLLISKLLINNSNINISESQSININSISTKLKYSKADINKAMNTWTLRASSDNSYQTNCWSPELGLFVAISTDGTNRIATSTNGIVWTDVVTSATTSSTLYSVCWSPELLLFVAVGGSGGNNIITSSDGINWTPRVKPEGNSWKSVCWSPELGLFVAVNGNGSYRVMISYNGIDWYGIITPTQQTWFRIRWANTLGLFVATSADSVVGSVMTSPDGMNWTVRNFPFAAYTTDLAWSQDLGMLIALSGSIYYFYSRDGINWYSNALPISAIWNTISWISDIGIFVALTISTLALSYSYDGLTWISVSISGNTNFYNSITWSSELNMLVACSSGGTTGFKMYTSELFSPNNKSCIMSNASDFSVNNTNGRVGIGLSSPSYQLQLSTDSASKPSTSTWTVSSDSRLKENIEDADLDLCYNNIKNLRLARYTWKDNVYTVDQVADRSKLGWIAQEVEAIFPKSVQSINAHGFDDCRTLNTDQIISSLYGCTQKLIKNYEDDDIILNSMNDKINSIQLFINNIPEE